MISVFIPVFNGAKYLRKTIESVLSQTYNDIELLCVDDSSTDDSLMILKEYAAFDKRIRVFSKRNEGDVPHAWHFVIPQIKGSYVLYMSQDDLLENNTIEKLVKRQRETNADAVIPIVVFYEENKSKEEVRNDIGVNGDVAVVLSGRESFELMIDYTIPGFALWSTEIIKNCGIKLDTYNCDELAQRKWILDCNKVAFSDGVFLFRRDNENCITRKFTSHYYESVYTDACLLNMMISVGMNNDTIVFYRNNYYKHFWECVMLFYMSKNNYSKYIKKRIKSIFYKTYPMINKGVTLTNWKYKYGSKNRYFFICVFLIKFIRAKVLAWF